MTNCWLTRNNLTSRLVAMICLTALMINLAPLPMNIRHAWAEETDPASADQTASPTDETTTPAEETTDSADETTSPTDETINQPAATTEATVSADQPAADDQAQTDDTDDSDNVDQTQEVGHDQSNDDSPLAETPDPDPETTALNAAAPSTSAPGEEVVLTGSGFTATDNTVQFGPTDITGLTSSDGTTLTFTVPADTVTDLVYQLRVVNGQGQVSTEGLSFTVTAAAENDQPAITLVAIAPTVGPAGTTIILTGTGFTATNTVQFGVTDITDLPSDGQTVSFQVPADTLPGLIYQIRVIDNQGQVTPDGLSFTVPADDDPAFDVTLTSLDPNQGQVGTAVTLTGNGFTTTNTIQFGTTDIADVLSDNSTTMSFTVPAGSIGGLTYLVRVITNTGTTSANGLSFLVTSPGGCNDDVISPSLPLVAGSSHEINTTSSNKTVSINWAASEDQGCSGLAGYSFVWDNASETIPDNSVDTTATGTDQTLDNGTWFFHLKAVDQAGNVSGVSHYGPVIIAAGGNGNGGGRGHGGGGGGGNQPPVATTTPPVAEPESCDTQSLTKFIKFGEANDPVEVRKLQEFLNKYENADLTVTSVYDLPTFEAIKRFQLKYAKDILGPWGVTEPSGYVYITTRIKINQINCGLDLPIELDFRNLVKPAATTPAATSTTGTTTPPAEPTPLEIGTERNFLQAAAAGILNFITGYPWWWWLIVAILILVIISLWRQDRDGGPDRDDQLPPTGGNRPRPPAMANQNQPGRKTQPITPEIPEFTIDLPSDKDYQDLSALFDDHSELPLEASSPADKPEVINLPPPRQ